MRNLNGLILILLFLLIQSCSINKKVIDQYSLLQEHLYKWQAFNANGIIELNYQSFAFRKNINLKKDSESWQITIFDKGIFGMKPTPFLAVKIDSVITINSALENEPQVISFNFDNQSGYLKNPTLLLNHSNEIIKKRKILLDPDLEIRFNPSLQIEMINHLQTEISLQFFYDPELIGMQLWQSQNLLANIEIDNIRYSENLKERN